MPLFWAKFAMGKRKKTWYEEKGNMVKFFSGARGLGNSGIM